MSCGSYCDGDGDGGDDGDGDDGDGEEEEEEEEEEESISFLFYFPRRINYLILRSRASIYMCSASFGRFNFVIVMCVHVFFIL